MLPCRDYLYEPYFEECVGHDGKFDEILAYREHDQLDIPVPWEIENEDRCMELLFLDKDGDGSSNDCLVGTQDLGLDEDGKISDEERNWSSSGSTRAVTARAQRAKTPERSGMPAPITTRAGASKCMTRTRGTRDSTA